MGRGSVGNDEEFPGDVLEENEGEGFDSITPKAGGKEKEMSRVMQSKMELLGEGGREVEVILQVGGEQE